MERDGKSKGIIRFETIVLTFAHLITHGLGRIYNALLPVIRSEFNLSLQQLGIIAAIPRLFETSLALPSGLIADRFSPRKILLISISILALGVLITSQAPDILIYTSATCLLFIHLGTYHPVSYSFMGRIFKRKDRAKAIGIHGGGGNFGTAIGPISAGILIGLLGSWRVVYLFWLFPVIGLLLALLLIRSEAMKRTETKQQIVLATSKNSLFNRNFGFLLLYRVFRMLGGSMITTFFTVYLVDVRGVDVAFASIITGVSAIFGLVAAPTGGFLAAKYGEKRWLVTAFSIAILCLSLAVLSPNISLFLFFYIAHMICNEIALAANQAIVARLSPRQSQGLGYGLFFLCGSSVGVVAPLLGALIGETFGLPDIFIATILVYIISLVVLKFGIKIPQNTMEE